MEFEEMQIIWNSQNNEKLYAINEKALFEKIKRKGRSVNSYVKFVEVVMILTNLVAGLLVMYQGVTGERSWGQITLASVYLLYLVYGIYRWFARRQDEQQFEQSMLGELNKAIWRSDYLMKQGHQMIFWYLLPIIVISIIFVLLEGGSWQTIGFLLLILPVTYYGGRWEIRKFHAPKKRELESLRETLMSAESENL